MRGFYYKVGPELLSITTLINNMVNAFLMVETVGTNRVDINAYSEEGVIARKPIMVNQQQKKSNCIFDLEFPNIVEVFPGGSRLCLSFE